MSTGYGNIKTRDGKRVYWDASDIAQRINLCGDNDSEVLASFTADEALSLYQNLHIALQHCQVEV